jgi:hypothetical protein
MLPLEGSECWLPSGEVVDVMVLKGRVGNGQDGEQGLLGFGFCSYSTSH